MSVAIDLRDESMASTTAPYKTGSSPNRFKRPIFQRRSAESLAASADGVEPKMIERGELLRVSVCSELRTSGGSQQEAA